MVGYVIRHFLKPRSMDATIITAIVALTIELAVCVLVVYALVKNKTA